MNGFTFTMGEVLRDWREKNGISLRLIAEKQNMEEKLLTRLERGEEVDCYVLLNYIDEVRRMTPDFDVVHEWRKGLGFER